MATSGNINAGNNSGWLFTPASQLQTLAASLTASSTLAAALGKQVSLAASLNATASFSATLEIKSGVALYSSLTATASLGAILGKSLRLSATTHAQSSLASGLRKAAPLSAALFSASTLRGTSFLAELSALPMRASSSLTVSNSFLIVNMASDMLSEAALIANLDTPGDQAASLKSSALLLASLSKAVNSSADLSAETSLRATLMLLGGSVDGLNNSGWLFSAAPVLPKYQNLPTSSLFFGCNF